MSRPRVAMVGGGITGLATAHYLASYPAAPDVIVLEAGPRLGGKIHTGTFAQLPVETGPDTMLARVPEALELCRRLGLSDQLVSPATGGAYVWARSRLRALPPGHLLGVPGDLVSLARSGILSPRGLGRASLDLVLPRSNVSDRVEDPTITQALAARLGHEAVEILVEPLLAGINAGRADRLSLAATAPDVADVAASSRSLILGVRARQRRRPPDSGRPVFVSLPGGLSRLIERLAGDLATRHVEVRTNASVKGIERGSCGGPYTLALQGTDELGGLAAVVITTTAGVASSLLADLSPATAKLLADIKYASVGVVTLAYPEKAVPRPLDGSGLLVPRREGWLLTAATWISSKWPALRPPGRVLVRASTGRSGDDRFAHLDDETLVGRLHHELHQAMGITTPPLESRVDRWPQSFPQYESGHRARVSAIEAGLEREVAGVVVAGSAYRGVGIASCIRQANEAARRVRDHLGGVGEPPSRQIT